MSAREISSPLLAHDPGLATAVHLLEARRRDAPEHVAFRVLPGEGEPGAELRPVTTAEFAEAVERAAGALLRAGVAPGERVLIIGETSFEWAVADFACWYAGAISVPVYPTASPEQVAETADLVTARIALVDTTRLDAEALLAGCAGTSALPFAELIAAPALSADEATAVGERWSARTPADIATIVFTSGTTGAPTPVQISHANLSVLVQNVQRGYSGLLRDGATTLILLPLAHVLARGLQLVCIHAGMTITHLGDPARVVDVLSRVRPTFLVVVPRVLEKVPDRLRGLAGRAKLGWAIRRAERVAIASARRRQAGERDSLRQRAEFAVWNRLLFARVRRLFGGRVEHLLSGAAALRPETSLFFDGAGLPVIEGYGLTETTAPATGQRPGDLRAGTVGPPQPGTTIRLAVDGEILVAGPGVCAAFGPDPATARPSTDADGFFHTGDIGRFDRGHLIVTGRKKELIVTSYGKTVAPQRWELGVETDADVSHALLVGEGRPFLLGLIITPGDAVGLDHAADRRASVCERDRLAGTTGLVRVTSGAALERFTARVDAENRSFARPEQARSIIVLAGHLDADPRFVTPTGKVRRGALLAELDGLIDAEYAALGRKG